MPMVTEDTVDTAKLCYRLQDVRDLLPYKTIYARAGDCVKEGRVLGICTERDADGYVTAASGRVRERGLWEVSASFSRRLGITAYRCSCPECTPLQGACKHVGALLLALYGMRPARTAPAACPADPRADTETLSRLVREVSAHPRSHLASLRLEPVAEELSSALTLSFRIGTDGSAAVRSVYDFADAMRNGARAGYGRHPSFIHVPGAFCEQSRPLALFLASAAAETRDYHDRLSPYATLGDARRLCLSPAQLDAFYDLWEGRHLASSEAVETGGITLGGSLADFALTVGGERILRLCADEDYRLLHGAAHTYVYRRGRLCRAEGDFARYCMPLLSTLLQQPDGALRITGPAASTFVSSLLEPLCRCARLSGAELLLSRYPPVRLRARVELCYMGGAVFARPQFIYGECVINPLLALPASEGRDLVAEDRVLSHLYAYGFTAFEQRLVLDREELLFAFAERGLAELCELCEVDGGEGFERLRVKKQPPLALSLSMEEGRLRLRFDGSEFSYAELCRAAQDFKRNRSFFRLRDDTLLELDAQSMGLLDSLAGLGYEPGTALPPARAFLLQALAQSFPDIALKSDGDVNALWESLQAQCAVPVAVPACVRAELRPYQLAGFEWLCRLESAGLGGILADDMGLGKTLQMLTLIAARPEAGRSLIVCPASLVYNWKHEAARFCPSLRVRTVTGTPEERARAICGEDCDVLITSYDLLRNDLALWEGRQLRLCVADEAQYIKNARTKNARAIKRIRARTCFALTGTPIENYLSDLHSIFEFVLPGLLPSARRFHQLYELPARRDGRVDAVLQKTVEPFILRRLKGSVLSELPEKSEITVPAAFGREQQRLYDAALAQTRSEFRALLAEHGGDTVRFLALLTRLRQLCCHPALCVEGYRGESAKLELCVELLREALSGGHRVLLFSQFTSMLELLRARLETEGISCLVLTGRTGSAERLALADAFNGGQGDVFLISLKAGGTGLNLTGADVVIHYDPWWNAAARNQATDRAYRIGQTRAVQVYRLICSGTVEEQMIELALHKEGLSDALVREGGRSLASLSARELAALLGDPLS